MTGSHDDITDYTVTCIVVKHVCFCFIFFAKYNTIPSFTSFSDQFKLEQISVRMIQGQL